MRVWIKFHDWLDHMAPLVWIILFYLVVFDLFSRLLGMLFK